MSISEAIRASTDGNKAEADRHTNRVLLKEACMREIFCACGSILDVRRSVMVISKDAPTTLTCALCFDRTLAEVAAQCGADEVQLALLGMEVLDGRVLEKRPRGARKEPTGNAKTITGVATKEKRPVALSEREVADLINDNVHHTCAGECECQVEPDGECCNFWPSQMRAVGMV